MNTLPQTKPVIDLVAIEKVLIQGDLAGLNIDQRLTYVKTVCESLGINHLTNPFGYIMFDGKVQLYAKKDCTEQLRRLYGVSVTDMTSKFENDLYIVFAKLQDATGRTDMSTGAVEVSNLKGKALANAIMKSETKAKRRGTLSICGLNILDESEVEDNPEKTKLRPPQSADPLKSKVEPSIQPTEKKMNSKQKLTVEAMDKNIAWEYDLHGIGNNCKDEAEKKAKWDHARKEFGAVAKDKIAYCAVAIPEWNDFLLRDPNVIDTTFTDINEGIDTLADSCVKDSDFEPLTK